MFACTKQDLIDELYVQRDNADSVQEWEELDYQIVQLQQELDIENMVEQQATSWLFANYA